MTSLLRAAWEEYERDRARYFAGSMVYFALMSLVPLLLLLLAAIGWSLQISSAAADMEARVLTVVETNLGEQFRVRVFFGAQGLADDEISPKCKKTTRLNDVA